MQEKIKLCQEKMDKTINVLQDDYATIRAGRANPHVLDKIKVDYYGTPTPIQQVGNISVPEARMIMIAPWEKSLLKEIEKAINMSDLGINPTNDGTTVDAIKKMEKASEISEDDLKDGENKVQKLTDKAIEEIDKTIENKSKEIMTV